MSTQIEDVKKRTRRTRRNYAKDWERLTFYLATVIRIKDDDQATNTDWAKGELKAYRDIQDYMGQGR